MLKIVGLSLSLCYISIGEICHGTEPSQKAPVLNWKHETIVLMAVLRRASKCQNFDIL